jgi:hypothetical protein
MEKFKTPRSNTGGYKKGSNHPDLLLKVAIVASYEAGMTYKYIRDKYCISKSSLFIDI